MQPTDRELTEMDLLDTGEAAIREAVEGLVEKLWDANAIRIHRDWSAATELAAIKDAATKAAVESILRSDWLVSMHDLAYAQRGLETNAMLAARAKREAA